MELGTGGLGGEGFKKCSDTRHDGSVPWRSSSRNSQNINARFFLLADEGVQEPVHRLDEVTGEFQQSRLLNSPVEQRRQGFEV